MSSNPEYFELFTAKKKSTRWGKRVEKSGALLSACKAWVRQPFYGGLNAAHFLKRTLGVARIRWRR